MRHAFAVPKDCASIVGKDSLFSVRCVQFRKGDICVVEGARNFKVKDFLFDEKFYCNYRLKLCNIHIMRENNSTQTKKK